MSGTTGRSAGVLREGSGIRVDGTAGAGLAISAYIKDTGNVPSQGLFCHDSIPRNSWASALRLCLSCGLRRASADGFHR